MALGKTEANRQCPLLASQRTTRTVWKLHITYFTSAEDDFYHLMFISKMLHHVFIKFKQIVYHSLVAW